MPGNFANLRVVLVNTSHPGNIGAAARAMKNMGIDRLYLVEPREFPAPRALWRAAGAADVLERAQVVGSLAEAVADCALVIGTSARERRIPWPLLDPRECGQRAWQESARHQVALVFGREDRGLTNDELAQCGFHVHIPANPDYSSLNLAAAVQVLAYEVRMAALADAGGAATQTWDVPRARAEDIELYFQHLERVLIEIGFHDPANPRQTLVRLRRLLARIRPDHMELSILRGVLTAMQNFVWRAGDTRRSAAGEAPAVGKGPAG